MREFFKQRRFIYFLVPIILLIAIAGIFAFLSSAKKELEGVRAQHKEMLLIKEELLSLKTRLEPLEGRKDLTKVKGIIPAIEDVFSSIQLKNKIKSIKPVGKRELSDSVEEEAEVSVEKVDMNEMVNLFYRIENSPMLLVLKRVNIRKSFERPELMNISMLISVVYAK